MKKRVALVGLIGIAVFSAAGLRGCWDFTKPTPWAAEARRHGTLDERYGAS